ncbi:hypothetical protein OJ998_04630 [Solirubrobacter taibaiensis]|nr:hypothetical protein [Solirubrobacter taibaiensis]
MSKIVLVPLEMQSVASDFDRKAAELERAAQAVQSPGLVAGLPPGNQATVAAQLRGVAGQLRGIADQQRDIADDLRRRARAAMQDQGFQRLLRDGGAIGLRLAVERWASSRDKKQIAKLKAHAGDAQRAYQQGLRNKKSTPRQIRKLRNEVREANKRLRTETAALADQAFEAATKAGGKIKNTAFESILKLSSSLSGNPLLDTIAKLNKLRRDVPVNIADQKKAWKKTDPITLEDLKRTSKGARKLPIVSTATLPWAAADAKKAWSHQKYKGTMNTIEKINDGVNIVGVGTQTVGAGTVGAGAAMSATGIGAVAGVPTMAVGGTIIAVGEGIQLVSLGADVGMIVWDKQGKQVIKAWRWVNPLD